MVGEKGEDAVDGSEAAVVVADGGVGGAEAKNSKVATGSAPRSASGGGGFGSGLGCEFELEFAW